MKYLEDPALVNVVLEGECLDHGSNGVGVDHSAAHDCRRVDSLKHKNWEPKIIKTANVQCPKVVASSGSRGGSTQLSSEPGGDLWRPQHSSRDGHCKMAVHPFGLVAFRNYSYSWQAFFSLDYYETLDFTEAKNLIQQKAQDRMYFKGKELSVQVYSN